jgi:hypothetical protein
MNINTEYIAAQLQRRADNGELPRVAAGAKVALRTLHRVKAGGSCRTATAQALQTYLQATESKRRLDDGGE